MAVSAFGVEDDRLSKSVGSSAAYQAVGRRAFGEANKTDRARRAVSEAGSNVRRVTGNAGRSVRDAGAKAKSAVGSAAYSARFGASAAPGNARRAADKAGRTVRLNAITAGQVAGHEAGRAGTAVRNAEYRPLHFTPDGLRTTTAGKVYGATAGAGAVGAAGGYANSRRKKD